MKRSILALAVLGASAGAAHAQSSVTLFGVVDTNLRYVDNQLASGGADSRKLVGTDGATFSRFGVRGVEDLGGGLRAGFWLEAPLAADTGTNPSAKFWNRRATVSVMGRFGEIRLGRDIVPSYWNTSRFDPFGAVGIGNHLNVSNFGNTGSALGQVFPPNPAPGTFLRSDNSVGYLLPSGLRGFYGQAMAAAGEGAGGKHFGARLGWTGGPVDVAVSAANTELNAAGTDDFRVANIAGSLLVGPVKLMAQFHKDKIVRAAAADPDEKRWLVGFTVPVGAGEIKGSYSRARLQNGGAVNGDANQIALGYVYNLSKRTALYVNASRLQNKGAGRFTLPGGPTPVRPGGESRGAEMGVAHTF